MPVGDSLAAGPKPWSCFDPPPMSVLCPEPQAISNPPFIHWQGTACAAAYRIELDGPDTRFRWETQHNFYTPAYPLPAGAYTLRIAALGDAGDEVASSPPASVFISGSATPPPADLNRIAGDPANSLFGSSLCLARIRNAGGETARFRDALVARARNLPESLKGDIREPGRYHGFVWDFDTWDRGNQTCFALEDAILGTALAWQLTGEAGFADEARRLMREVAAWDPRGATGVWENDHSAQALLHSLAMGYSALKGVMPAEERSAVRDAIRARCVDAYGYQNPFVLKDLSCGPMGDPDNNHPWFVTSALGLGALALAGEDPHADEWAAFAAQMHWGVYLPRGDCSGGWHEGIDYWSYTLFFVFQFADGLRNAAGVDLYRHPWLRSTALFKVLTHPPAGGYVPFGDCKHHLPNAFDRIIMMRLAQECASPLCSRYADAVADPVATLRHLVHAAPWSEAREAHHAMTEETLPKVAHFGEIGWVVANTDPFEASGQLLFAFRSGGDAGRKAAHSHADQNAFVLCAGGDRLLWDAGYYDSYLSDHHRDYSRQSAAHNVILVDGIGQAVCEPGIRGRIVRFERDGDRLVVAGDASDPSIYQGRLSRFVRTIEVDLSGSLELRDEIVLPRPAIISFLLHSAHPIGFDPASGRISISGAHRRLEGEFAGGTPITAAVTTRFPVAPTLRLNRVLEGGDDYADQWHLEIRTAVEVAEWRPRLTLRVLAA